MSSRLTAAAPRRKPGEGADVGSGGLAADPLLASGERKAHRPATAAWFGLSKVAVAAAASVGWMAASSALILLNKDLLSGGFPYPMTLSAMGMACSGAASWLACRAAGVGQGRGAAGGGSGGGVGALTPRFYVRRILPVGLFMALTLHFGNLVYLYLTVAFIQMLKAFTPIITMVTLFLSGLERSSPRLVGSVCGIALGTALASAGEGQLDALGVVIMCASMVFEGIRLAMTQQLLVTGLRLHPMEGLMYMAPACTLWLALGAVLLELQPMRESGALVLVAARPAAFASASLMAWAVNILGYIVIQTASSLTLKVLGTVKNALVVCLGVALLRERVTTLQAFGYSISVAAFLWYQWVKMQGLGEDAQGAAAAAAAPGGGAVGRAVAGSRAAPRHRMLPVGTPEEVGLMRQQQQQQQRQTSPQRRPSTLAAAKPP